MKLHLVGKDSVAYKCPGCQDTHVITVSGLVQPVWKWNGSFDQPTFFPSILVRSGHFANGWNGGSCWCTYREKHPESPAPFICSKCHCMIQDGMIEFLSDSSHSLAGRTVEIPEWK